MEERERENREREQFDCPSSRRLTRIPFDIFNPKNNVAAC